MWVGVSLGFCDPVELRGATRRPRRFVWLGWGYGRSADLVCQDRSVFAAGLRPARTVDTAGAGPAGGERCGANGRRSALRVRESFVRAPGRSPGRHDLGVLGGQIDRPTQEPPLKQT